MTTLFKGKNGTNKPKTDYTALFIPVIGICGS